MSGDDPRYPYGRPMGPDPAPGMPDRRRVPGPRWIPPRPGYWIPDEDPAVPDYDDPEASAA